MITIFNRREIYNGFSLKGQTQVRNILAQNGIDYSYKSAPTALGGNSGGYAPVGMGADETVRCVIYVHKKNYEKAQFLIKRQMSW